MENVYFYVSIAAFVLAAVLAVAAVVVFVKMDVINAIRFLQGKRVPTSGESSRHRTTRGSRGVGAKKPNPARSVLSDSVGDDRVTDIAHEGPEGDDNMTTVVAPISDEPASARHAKAHVAKVETDVRDENDDEGFAGSETPTEVLTEDDMETERPTGVLVEDEDDSERPTGVLVEDEEDSERPTGVLVEDEEDSERPTGVLTEDEDEESERPTGVLVEDDEESERSTGLLIEEDEESERETGLLDEADEDSEQETGLLDEGAEASESETDVLGEGDVYENIGSQGVVQHEDDGFRFILKQNVIVVHTDQSIDRLYD